MRAKLKGGHASPPLQKIAVGLGFETSAKHHFVILSGAKDLIFSRNYEILRSHCSLRMTNRVIFAEGSIWYYRRNQFEWSGGTDRTLGVGSDNFFCEGEPIALEDQNPAQERRSQSSQEAQDLKGLKGSYDSRQRAQQGRVVVVGSFETGARQAGAAARPEGGEQAGHGPHPGMDQGNVLPGRRQIQEGPGLGVVAGVDQYVAICRQAEDVV